MVRFVPGHDLSGPVQIGPYILTPVIEITTFVLRVREKSCNKDFSIKYIYTMICISGHMIFNRRMLMANDTWILLNSVDVYLYGFKFQRM